jgi:hypothetical protein
MCVHVHMLVRLCVCVCVCVWVQQQSSALANMHVKLGSAELSASEKVGDETTNLFSPLEKSQRGIH